MRPASLGELTLLARVLTPVDPVQRMHIAQKILAEVDVAAQHLRQFGRVHPEFGDGSLMARCLAFSPVAEPFTDDPAFLVALIIACRTLRKHYKM